MRSGSSVDTEIVLHQLGHKIEYTISLIEAVFCCVLPHFIIFSFDRFRVEKVIWTQLYKDFLYTQAGLSSTMNSEKLITIGL